jgi:hypothetical protein
MGRTVLLLLALVSLLAAGVIAVNGASDASGIQERIAKEENLSVTATAAPIDQRQPQHLKTATFALG